MGAPPPSTFSVTLNIILIFYYLLPYTSVEDLQEEEYVLEPGPEQFQNRRSRAGAIPEAPGAFDHMIPLWRGGQDTCSRHRLKSDREDQERRLKGDQEG